MKTYLLHENPVRQAYLDHDEATLMKLIKERLPHYEVQHPPTWDEDDTFIVRLTFPGFMGYYMEYIINPPDDNGVIWDTMYQFNHEGHII